MDMIYMIIIIIIITSTHSLSIKNISVSIVYHYVVIITGVSYKKYRKTLGKRAKRHHILYGYDENGHFIRKRVSRFEAFFRNFQKKKRFRFICSTCSRSYQAFNQKKKEVKCPYCD